MRSSGSPACLSSRECMSTQMLQPLIWLARSSTRYSVASGISACLAAFPSPCSAVKAPGTVSAGLSIRACMIGPPLLDGCSLRVAAQVGGEAVDQSAELCRVSPGGVREGMVESVKRMASVDLELEAVVGSRVVDTDGDAARGLVPEQVYVDSVAGAVSQLPSSDDPCGHVLLLSTGPDAPWNSSPVRRTAATAGDTHDARREGRPSRAAPPAIAYVRPLQSRCLLECDLGLGRLRPGDDLRLRLHEGSSERRAHERHAGQARDRHRHERKREPIPLRTSPGNTSQK